MNVANPESLPRLAESRVAGVCYLIVIAAGVFAALFVRDSLLVAGNAAATAEAIATHATRWRWGIVVHLLYLPAGAAVGVILYRFFRHVQPTLALLALGLTLSDVALEALLMTALYVPLVVLEEPAIFAVFSSEQRAAVTYLGVRLFLRGWGFALFLFGGFCILTGILIIRSRWIPVAIGVLMVAAGSSYMALTLSQVLAPAVAHAIAPWLLMPPFVGELALAVWLTAKGVRPNTSRTPSPALGSPPGRLGSA